MLDAQAEPPLDQNPKCREADENGHRLAQAVLATMDQLKTEALVDPTWNNPPRLIGDLNSSHGNNSSDFATDRVPAITVSMGYPYGSLPAGLQILGRPGANPP